MESTFWQEIKGRDLFGSNFCEESFSKKISHCHLIDFLFSYSNSAIFFSRVWYKPGDSMLNASLNTCSFIVSGMETVI